MEYIQLSEEVKNALDKDKPIIAIETGGTFEGFAYPENEKVALEVQDAVRKAGVIPAYISIMDGKVKIGMSDEEIAEYGKKRDAMAKASRREIPLILAQNCSAIMTIAATMMMADYVGIPIVAGGGLGGVHRGAETTMDISSDLEEISQRNVIVVCSGVKSILDLSLTMEYLETKSVPVIGYKTDEFPAHMVRSSGIKLSSRMDEISEIAKAYDIKNKFGIKSGMLVTNPIDEAFSVDSGEMNAAIDEAIELSIRDRIKGKAITAYLMKHVKSVMGDDSAEAQKHMIIQNAILAAEISKALLKHSIIIN